MTPTEQALRWNREREERSRPLTAVESGMIERARQTVLMDLPKTVCKYRFIKAALAGLRTDQVRVKIGTDHDPGKSEFGIITLLAKSPVELGEHGCRVALVKIASVSGARRHVCELLHRRAVTMDWFVEEFPSHGHLVGRAAQLASWMLAKINAHTYIDAHGLGTELGLKPAANKVWVPRTSLALLIMFQATDLVAHRQGMYRKTVANPKATCRPRDSAESYSEERVWKEIFGQVGVKFYHDEARSASDRRERPSKRRLAASGSAYLQ